LVEEDPVAIAALKQCGLWKFFQCPFMRAQPRLLNALVEYWHPDAEAFMLEGQSLTPTMEDIYFLTGLSRRGEPVNLRTFPPGPFNIEDYIRMYCEAGTEKVGSQVPIHKITNLSLRSDLTFDRVDYWIHNTSSGLTHTYALCHSVLGGNHFLLEYHHACMHEETTYRVSVTYQQELRVWYYLMLLLL
jgi:hypothetical protein